MLFSCSKTSSPTGPGGNVTTECWIIVINNLAETVSLVKTSDWSTVVNAVGTGQVPNDADTMGGFLYVVCSQSSTLDRYRKSGDGICFESSINLGNTVNPFGLDCQNSKIYVSCFMSDELVVATANPYEIKKRINIGKAPEGVLAEGQTVFVACTAYNSATYSYGQGYVYAVSAVSDSVLDSIKVGTNPQYMAAVAGEIHVSCTGDWGVTVNGRIYIIDPVNLSVKDSILIEGTPMGLCPSGNDSVYVAAGGWGGSGNLYLYRKNGEILRGKANPIIVPEGAMDVEYWRGKIYVACFGADSIAEVTGDSVARKWLIGDGPQAITVW